MNKTLIALTCAGSLSLLGACASTPDEDPMADANNTEQSDDGLSGSGYAGRPGTQPEAQISERPDSQQAEPFPDLKSVVYFEFDSSQLDAEAERIVEAHARKLRANPQARLRLEGHTDERGSREYNIALGERRAESVQRALLLRGVPRQQVTVVSYGEESPVAYGSGESAWSQNRRVEFNYL